MTVPITQMMKYEPFQTASGQIVFWLNAEDASLLRLEPFVPHVLPLREFIDLRLRFTIDGKEFIIVEAEDV